MKPAAATHRAPEPWGSRSLDVSIVGDEINRQTIQRQRHVDRLLAMTPKERLGYLGQLEQRAGKAVADRVADAFLFAWAGSAA